MSIGKIMEVYQFFWMFESHAEQRLAWLDAAEARVARIRAETRAAEQHQAMLEANPSGQLGHSVLNDASKLLASGLL